MEIGRTCDKAESALRCSGGQLADSLRDHLQLDGLPATTGW
jgi:hypothetical protein